MWVWSLYILEVFYVMLYLFVEKCWSSVLLNPNIYCRTFILEFSLLIWSVKSHKMGTADILARECEPFDKTKKADDAGGPDYWDAADALPCDYSVSESDENGCVPQLSPVWDSDRRRPQ
jgi:hypothetical protein